MSAASSVIFLSMVFLAWIVCYFVRFQAMQEVQQDAVPHRETREDVGDES